MIVRQQHHLGYILTFAFTPHLGRFTHLCSLHRGVVNARRIHTFAKLDLGRSIDSCLSRGRCDAPAVSTSPTMANSRFQYVKKFELSDALLPDTYLIARLDGHRFTKFTADHGFSKPNDERGLLLMAECARQVMSEWSDLVMAFGQSDEFSFLLPASSPLYGRRSAKLSTSFVSLFSSSFVFFWPKHFPDAPLLYPPNFDARIVSYPSAQHVRDYFAWRQADCHINNLYNTCFWALVADGVSKQDAQVALKGTTSGDKNELLFSRFDTNYNDVPQRFRKGTTLFRARPTAAGVPSPEASQQRPGQGNAAANRGGEKGGDLQAIAESVAGQVGGAVEENSTGPQASGAAKTEVPALAAVERCPAAVSSADGNPGSAVEAQKARGGDKASAGVASAAGEEEAGAGPTESFGKEKTAAKAKSASGGEAIVRVVSCADGKGRAKRLLKKGHAPPGVIEEEACDLIRDDFWDRNPHILAGGVGRR
ncbi:unnamed protein product [Scytosiphon promiscuus]